MVQSKYPWREGQRVRFDTVHDPWLKNLAPVVGAKDNNYRNMMRRDLENKGEEYVRKTYPARAKYCIPILVDTADAPW